MANFWKDDLVNQILNYWYDPKNKNIWFSATLADDQYITKTFSKLLDSPDILSPNLLNPLFLRQFSNRQILAYIIVFDQFVRHIHRGNTEKIKYYSQFSLNVSMCFIQTNRDWELLPQERTFLLLPLRHTFDEYYIWITIKKMQEYMRAEPANAYYKRFMNATLRSYSNIITPKLVPVPILPEDTDYSDVRSILDMEQPSPTNLETIYEFIDFKDKTYTAFADTVKELLIDGKTETITISLSGGIDSMISTFILYHLSKKQTVFKLKAIMLNYGNRKECATEVKFVTRYCNLLSIPLYVRHITEMSRDVDTRHKYRDLYEEITRFFRFSAYKFMASPIILGHNQDDCEENIITNIRKQRSNENLRGMARFGVEDDVLIVRPMLNISKEQIFAFSEKYQIPHLRNSTPSWCDRGKMREVLIPFLNKFDPAFIPGLLKLSDHFRELYQIYDRSVVQEFNKTIVMTDAEYRIPIQTDSKERLYGYIFWKDVIINFCKAIHVGFPSSKAIVTLINRLHRNTFSKIPITKDISLQFNSTGLVYRF